MAAHSPSQLSRSTQKTLKITLGNLSPRGFEQSVRQRFLIGSEVAPSLV